MICLYFFPYRVVNIIVQWHNYIMLNSEIRVNGQLEREDESDCGLFYGTIPAFSWRKFNKPQKLWGYPPSEPRTQTSQKGSAGVWYQVPYLKTNTIIISSFQSFSDFRFWQMTTSVIITGDLPCFESFTSQQVQTKVRTEAVISCTCLQYKFDLISEHKR